MKEIYETLGHIIITGQLSVIFFILFTWNNPFDIEFLLLPFLCGMIIRTVFSIGECTGESILRKTKQRSTK